MWSISEAKTFRRCQRQWYYRYRFGAALAKKVPARREAYVLGSLQTISAWRGQLVDQVIEHFIVPALNRREEFYLSDALAYARNLFDRQLAFARDHQVRRPNMTKDGAGLDFAALLTVEQGLGVVQADLDKAWEEITAALRNLFAHMEEIKDDLKRGRRRVAQPKLFFEVAGVKAKAIPDLVVYFNDEPPMIVDWKVHYFGVQEARLQLATYALALVRSGRAEHGRSGDTPWRETDIVLIEAQLLNRQLRRHALTAEDVLSLENEIAQSSLEMDYACGGTQRDDLQPEQFLRTTYLENCERCGFHPLCWKDAHDRA
jgi:hypothetical protein